MGPAVVPAVVAEGQPRPELALLAVAAGCCLRHFLGLSHKTHPTGFYSHLTAPVSRDCFLTVVVPVLAGPAASVAAAAVAAGTWTAG